MIGPVYAKVTHLSEQEQALEASMADAIAEVFAATTGLSAVRTSPNVVTLTKARDGASVEVQVIVKCATPHELRDDLWDAILDRQDMDTSCTDLANAAMERLGYPRPDGGWPK